MQTCKLGNISTHRSWPFAQAMFDVSKRDILLAGYFYRTEYSVARIQHFTHKALPLHADRVTLL